MYLSKQVSISNTVIALLILAFCRFISLVIMTSMIGASKEKFSLEWLGIECALVGFFALLISYNYFILEEENLWFLAGVVVLACLGLADICYGIYLISRTYTNPTWPEESVHTVVQNYGIVNIIFGVLILLPIGYSMHVMFSNTITSKAKDPLPLSSSGGIMRGLFNKLFN